MGKKKRSRSRSKSDIKRKVRKLEQKLQKYVRQYQSSSESEDYYLADAPDESVQEEYDRNYDDVILDDDDGRNQNEPATQPAPEPATPPPPPPPLPPPPPPQPTALAPPPPQNVPGSSSAPVFLLEQNNAQETSNTEDAVPPLDAEILQLLGEDPADQIAYGDNLHKDIASRWTHLLKNGLTKECKQDLLQQYLPPANCLYTKAPKLNLEIKAAMTEINIKKDVYSQSKQNQLSSALSAIGKALNWAISSKDTLPQAQEIIKPLSDAARLICDCHYRESQSRRFAIVHTLNKQTKDTVKDSKIDEYLFGANLSDQIKSSKAISKSGSEMKATVPPRVPYKPPTTQIQRGTLNSRGAMRVGAAAGEPRRIPAPRGPAAPAYAPRDRPPLPPRRYEPPPYHHYYSSRSSRALTRRR